MLSCLRFIRSKLPHESQEREPPPRGPGTTTTLYGSKVHTYVHTLCEYTYNIYNQIEQLRMYVRMSTFRGPMELYCVCIYVYMLMSVLGSDA